MPSPPSEPERREMQTVLPIFILSRLASFPACLATGWACVLPRPRRGVATLPACPEAIRGETFLPNPAPSRLKAAPTGTEC